MKLGTEGNHLLPSGSSNGVWGMNLANEKQWDRPAGFPECPVSARLFQSETTRRFPHPRGRTRMDPQRTGIQASVSIISPSLVGSASSLGTHALFRDPFQRALLQRNPHSQGAALCPHPWAGRPISPAFPLGQCQLPHINTVLHVLSSTCNGASCVF